MGRLVDLTATAEVAAPASTVWTVLADYERDPEWRTGVVSMTATGAGPDGLVRTGTTTVEHLRLGGRRYRNDGEVTWGDDGRAFHWRTTEGADAEGSREVRAITEDRCEVTMTLRVRPRGVERLLAPVLGRMLRRNLERDLARLALLVARASSADAPAAERSPG